MFVCVKDRTCLRVAEQKKTELTKERSNGENNLLV